MATTRLKTEVQPTPETSYISNIGLPQTMGIVQQNTGLMNKPVSHTCGKMLLYLLSIVVSAFRKGISKCRHFMDAIRLLYPPMALSGFARDPIH